MTNKCNICKNKDICKYKEEYEKEFNQVKKLDSNKMFPITLDCNYFVSKEVWTYRGIDISSGGETTIVSEGCEGCPTYELIRNGMAGAGAEDICYFCQNNKNKVTC